MIAIDNTDIIHLWEVGHQQSPTERAILLLTHHYGSDQEASIPHWPLGVRDHALMLLFVDTFGPSGNALATCPTCDQRLAFQIDLQSMGQGARDVKQPLNFTYEGESYTFRLPTSIDALALSAAREHEAGPRFLAQSCITSSAPDTHPTDRWSDAALSAFAEAMEHSDPFAEIWMAISCPGCDHRWREPFDIVDFFWRILTQQAQTLLRQVDLLARSYGWSEDEILNLSATRRALYVEMILT